jgi:Flp pilus assembly protein TadD
MLGRHEQALYAFDQALARNPAHGGAWAGRAVSLQALGRVAEAEVAERRAHDLGFSE